MEPNITAFSIEEASFHFTEEALRQKALATLRIKCFLGALCTGSASGSLHAWLTDAGFTAVAFGGLIGTIMLMFSGFIGGLTGVLARNTFLYLRGLPLDQGEASTDGIVLGALAGAFISLIFKLMTWTPETAILAVGLGTMTGSFLGALPGEHVGILAMMLASEEL